MAKMTFETSHSLRHVFDCLDWSVLSGEVGEKLLKNREVFIKLLMMILSGKIEVDPDKLEIRHKSGTIKLE